jgi:hypothetical protein
MRLRLRLATGLLAAAFAFGFAFAFGSRLVSVVDNTESTRVPPGPRAVATLPRWERDRLPSVAFVVTCIRSHQAKDDPILFPGTPGASHLHSFFGNRSTKASSSVADMLQADTSCEDPQDTAAYWVPAPGADRLRAYYDAGDAESASVRAYPAAMMGIAGDPEVQAPGVQVVAFRCGELGDGPDATQWEAVAPKSCSVGVPIVRYSFGQCESTTTRRLSPCQPGQTPKYVRLRLLMEFQSSAHGLGPHADFWNTWDQDRLEQLVATCVRGERLTNLEIKQCGLPGSGPIS